MALKRHSSLETGGDSESPTRARGAKRRCCDHHDYGYTMLEFMEKLDPSELRLVQQLCQKYLINVPHLSSSCRARIYRLQFRNKLPDILFTDRKIKDENNMKVEIVLVDDSNKVITSGPMASSEIQVVVLDGDFRADENGEWTEEEFKKHVIVARKDKRPLLIGNLFIKLCNGVGCISDAKFTDNSSWIKTKNFRLGVILCGGTNKIEEVQEGISNAFRVKDRHGESSQKDRPPSINDEVCCLKGIFKNGPYHKKLVECNINTVQDFLCHCSNNHEMLRSIIGMPKGAWEKTFRHALEATGTSGILLNGCVKLPAPDQNSFEVTGSSSSQISNVLEQHNDARRLISPECQPPISDMSAMAYRGFESKNIFKTNSITGEEAWEGTEQLDISLEVLMDKNGRSRVPNKFDLSSLLPRYKCLKLLLFVARLKVAALRSRENKFSKISLSSGNADGLNCFYSGDSYWGDLSPFEPWDGWYDLDF